MRRMVTVSPQHSCDQDPAPVQAARCQLHEGEEVKTCHVICIPACRVGTTQEGLSQRPEG